MGQNRVGQTGREGTELGRTNLTRCDRTARDGMGYHRIGQDGTGQTGQDGT